MKRRPRIYPGLLLLVLAAVNCYIFEEQLLTPMLWISIIADDADVEIIDIKEILDEEEERQANLLSAIHDSAKLTEDVDSDAIRSAALNGEDSEHMQWDTTQLDQLKPYTLFDIMREAENWETAFAIILYNPQRDKFIGLYSEELKWKSSCKKLRGVMPIFVNMLRRAFPDRFQGSKSHEFAVAIASGDSPGVKFSRLPHTDGVAPVLQFGSVFRDSNLYPNMIGMPMFGEHLNCFALWSRTKRVCESFRPMKKKGQNDGTLIFGHEFGLKWDHLIPQVMWRGTDHTYLPNLLNPASSRPVDDYIGDYIQQQISSRAYKQGRKRVVMRTLMFRHYKKLLPRWKGVALTAQAEMEVDDGISQTKLPWANIKFSRYLDTGGIMPTIGSKKYKQFEEIGIAVGKELTKPELAKYKYHIDIGGGGGTTWTGTHQKLAMPGLLFHHITPTKDYIHDRLRPWKHYIPVAPDLLDLREKFEWVKSHPQYAKRIAEQATDFMRRLGTPNGFNQMYYQNFFLPLRQVVKLYQPASQPMKWNDVLNSTMGNKWHAVFECTGGNTYLDPCKFIPEWRGTLGEWHPGIK